MHRLPDVASRPEHVVFNDETSVKTNQTCQRGWSRRGERPVMDAPFGSCGAQTLISGPSAGALIAPWVINGAIDGDDLQAYVAQVLVPKLEPGTVVILDNLAAHKNAAAAKAMREAGFWFLFMPPYAPDLNPIEMAFSKLNAHPRRVSARTCADIFRALTEICDLFLPEECWNFFKATRYVSGLRSGTPGISPSDHCRISGRALPPRLE